MKKIILFMSAVMVVALAVGATGCTMHITMNPDVSAAGLAGKRIPGEITLFADSEFENYHWHGFSDAELSKLDYELGFASKNLFFEAFKIASNGVTVVESMPTYTDSGRNDLVLVVHPAIAGFNEKHSLWIRNADYYAEITYHVTVYDKAGKIVLENDYSARGVAMGGANVSRNYAAPAEKAMEQAIVTIIDDIKKLREQ